MLSASFQQDTAVLQPGQALDDGDFDTVDGLPDPGGLEIRLSTRLAIPLFGAGPPTDEPPDENWFRPGGGPAGRRNADVPPRRACRSGCCAGWSAPRTPARYADPRPRRAGGWRRCGAGRAAHPRSEERRVGKGWR